MATKDNFFVKNKSIITFLVLEVVALTAFNFGNNSAIFGIGGGVLALGALLFAIMTKKDFKSYLILIAPVAMLLFVSILGAVNPFSQIYAKDQYVNIALAVGLPGFLILGFCLRKLGDVKAKTVLLVVGGAFALACVLGLFSTLIEYGLFYSLIYKGTPNYYYNGSPYDVTKEMYWLMGFEFNEVFVEYGSLFAILPASFLVGLLFISPKKERNEFIICAAIGAIGLLTLLVIPNLKAIIILAIASGFAFVYKFLKNYKRAQKIIGFSFLGIVALILLFFILALINAATGFHILPRVFVKNGIMQNIVPTLKAVFTPNYDGSTNLFGIVPDLIANEDALLSNTGVFEVELLKEVGLFGTLVFVGLVVYIGYLTFKYLKNSKDEGAVKSVLVVMLLAFFIYESLCYTINVQVHGSSYAAFLKSPVTLVMLFLMGYIISDSHKKKEEATNE